MLRRFSPARRSYACDRSYRSLCHPSHLFFSSLLNSSDHYCPSDDASSDGNTSFSSVAGGLRIDLIVSAFLIITVVIFLSASTLPILSTAALPQTQRFRTDGLTSAASSSSPLDFAGFRFAMGQPNLIENRPVAFFTICQSVVKSVARTLCAQREEASWLATISESHRAAVIATANSTCGATQCYLLDGSSAPGGVGPWTWDGGPQSSSSPFAEPYRVTGPLETSLWRPGQPFDAALQLVWAGCYGSASSGLGNDWDDTAYNVMCMRYTCSTLLDCSGNGRLTVAGGENATFDPRFGSNSPVNSCPCACYKGFRGKRCAYPVTASIAQTVTISSAQSLPETFTQSRMVSLSNSMTATHSRIASKSHSLTLPRAISTSVTLSNSLSLALTESSSVTISLSSSASASPTVLTASTTLTQYSQRPTPTMSHTCMYDESRVNHTCLTLEIITDESTLAYLLRGEVPPDPLPDNSSSTNSSSSTTNSSSSPSGDLNGDGYIDCNDVRMTTVTIPFEVWGGRSDSFYTIAVRPNRQNVEPYQSFDPLMDMPTFITNTRGGGAAEVVDLISNRTRPTTGGFALHSVVFFEPLIVPTSVMAAINASVLASLDGIASYATDGGRNSEARQEEILAARSAEAVRLWKLSHSYEYVLFTFAYSGSTTLNEAAPFYISLNPQQTFRCPLPGQLTFKMVAGAAPRYNVLPDGLSDALGILTSLLMLPSAAVMLGMLTSIQSMSRCEGANLEEELDFMSNPLGFEFGSPASYRYNADELAVDPTLMESVVAGEQGRYQRGAIVGAFVVYLFYSAILVSMSFAQWALRRLVEWREGNRPSEKWRRRREERRRRRVRARLAVAATAGGEVDTKAIGGGGGADDGEGGGGGRYHRHVSRFKEVLYVLLIGFPSALLPCSAFILDGVSNAGITLLVFSPFVYDNIVGAVVLIGIVVYIIHVGYVTHRTPQVPTYVTLAEPCGGGGTVSAEPHKGGDVSGLGASWEDNEGVMNGDEEMVDVCSATGRHTNMRQQKSGAPLALADDGDLDVFLLTGEASVTGATTDAGLDPRNSSFRSTPPLVPTARAEGVGLGLGTAARSVSGDNNGSLIANFSFALGSLTPDGVARSAHSHHHDDHDDGQGPSGASLLPPHEGSDFGIPLYPTATVSHDPHLAAARGGGDASSGDLPDILLGDADTPTIGHHAPTAATLLPTQGGAAKRSTAATHSSVMSRFFAYYFTAQCEWEGDAAWDNRYHHYIADVMPSMRTYRAFELVCGNVIAALEALAFETRIYCATKVAVSLFVLVSILFIIVVIRPMAVRSSVFFLSITYALQIASCTIGFVNVFLQRTDLETYADLITASATIFVLLISIIETLWFLFENAAVAKGALGRLWALRRGHELGDLSSSSTDDEEGDEEMPPIVLPPPPPLPSEPVAAPPLAPSPPAERDRRGMDDESLSAIQKVLSDYQSFYNPYGLEDGGANADPRRDARAYTSQREDNEVVLAHARRMRRDASLDRRALKRRLKRRTSADLQRLMSGEFDGHDPLLSADVLL